MFYPPHIRPLNEHAMINRGLPSGVAMTDAETQTPSDGVPLQLARPTIMDLIEAIDINAKNPAEGRAWLLHRHLLDDLGLPVFFTLDDAKQCPAHIAAPAIVAIEGLYNEGRD